MTNALVAFFLAAGVGSFVYSKMGKRVGYSNTQSLWTIIGVAFVLTYAVVYVTAAYVIHLH